MLARIWSVTPMGRWAASSRFTPMRPADAGNAVQRVLELRVVGDHLGVLVDDDEQVRVGLVAQVQSLLAGTRRCPWCRSRR